MTAVLALVLGALIGAVLGSLGGGGAVLTVPALVYLLGEDARDATGGSLVIVGLTAAFGVVEHARSGRVRWGTGALFGVVGAAAAVAGTVVNRRLDPDVLLLGFAALTAVAAAGMLLRSDPRDGDEGDGGEVPGGAAGTRSRAGAAGRILLAGLAVGFLTGLFGVGGGFVIVPAMVLALRLPMPAAVGTSLLVIAVNSAASLAARGGAPHLDAAVVVPFTLAAMGGSLAGKRAADRLPAALLTRAFAVLLLAVAAYVAATSAAALT